MYSDKVVVKTIEYINYKFREPSTSSGNGGEETKEREQQGLSRPPRKATQSTIDEWTGKNASSRI